MANNGNALSSITDYFNACFEDYGATPKGVDYRGAERQEACFEQLVKLLPVETSDFSLIDYGCGYGALYKWLLKQRGDQFDYQGFDLVAPMIDAAKAAYAPDNIRFTADETELEPADYVIASGIFNLRQQVDDTEWLDHIKATLDRMWALSEVGMAFNILTSYSDADKLRDHLYYADPCLFFDHCKRRYSRNVALLHDYDVYEFTILVRRTAA